MLHSCHSFGPGHMTVVFYAFLKCETLPFALHDSYEWAFFMGDTNCYQWSATHNDVDQWMML